MPPKHIHGNLREYYQCEVIVMRKKTMVLTGVTAAAFLLFCLLFSMTVGWLQAKGDMQAGAYPHYTITQVEGQLAVYSPGEKEPQLYDVYIDTLPQTEQQRLREGVEVYTQRELKSLLEDYTS